MTGPRSGGRRSPGQEREQGCPWRSKRSQIKSPEEFVKPSELQQKGFSTQGTAGIEADSALLPQPRPTISSGATWDVTQCPQGCRMQQGCSPSHCLFWGADGSVWRPILERLTLNTSNFYLSDLEALSARVFSIHAKIHQRYLLL